MTVAAEPYIRKNYGGVAVRVTPENAVDTAEWCGGLIENPWKPSAVFIHVPVVNSKYKKKNQAHVGDWILLDDDGFKVFTNEVFCSIYRPWGEE